MPRRYATIAATAAAEPELLAHHFTQAGLTEAAIEWWGKAGQRSLERSALVEAAEQFTRALAQIATLPATPASVASRSELQVALDNALMPHQRVCGAGNQGGAELARKLIEQAEALGEPPEDPLLLFSVLYGFWGVDRIAVNGDAMRKLAAQFLALASRSKTRPCRSMIGHRIMGISLLLTGDISQGRAYLDRAIALYDPVEHSKLATRFARTLRSRSCAIARSRCGCLVILMPRSRTRSASLRDAREIGQAATLMFALHHSSLTQILLWTLRGGKRRCRRTCRFGGGKGRFVMEGVRNTVARLPFALTGNASDAIHAITAGIAALRSTGSTMWMPLLLTYLARAHADARPIR